MPLTISTPARILEEKAELAKALRDIVIANNLWVNIPTRGVIKKVLLAEAWTTLAGLCELSPVVVETRMLEDGWWARAELRDATGMVRGGGESVCRSNEGTGKAAKASWESYALLGMAQTRAVSRAIRNSLGFIIQLAGYSPTPADEMDFVSPEPETTPVEVTAKAPVGRSPRSEAVDAFLDSHPNMKRIDVAKAQADLGIGANVAALSDGDWGMLIEELTRRSEVAQTTGGKP